jgi:hypothetical protein
MIPRRERRNQPINASRNAIRRIQPVITGVITCFANLRGYGVVLEIVAVHATSSRPVHCVDKKGVA